MRPWGEIVRIWLDNIVAPFRKTAPLISPIHPFTVVMYLGMVALGYIYILAIQTSDAMAEFIGEIYVLLWASAIAFGGVLAFLGALRATIKPEDVRPGLRLETWGCILILVTNVLYLIGLALAGVSPQHTIVLTQTVVGAAALRILLNIFEFRKIRWREREATVHLFEDE